MFVLPSHFKIVKGIGISKYPLVAFDSALQNAGIGDYNLVKVSSIIPAKCQKTDIIDLPKGSILYAAYSSITIPNDPQQYVGVGVAVPNNSEESGVIFECRSEKKPDDILRNMCKEAMDSREKKDYEYFECIQSVSNSNNDLFFSAIAAVVLW